MTEDKYQYEWQTGENGAERIYQFLWEMDEYFVPKLSERVSVEAYAKKLSQRADNLFVMVFIQTVVQDIASCSMYCNEETAFISSFAVKSDFWREHVGSRMMDVVKQHAKELQCRKIRLEVDRNNMAACGFYSSCGFRMCDSHGNWNVMEYILR